MSAKSFKKAGEIAVDRFLSDSGQEENVPDEPITQGAQSATNGPDAEKQRINLALAPGNLSYLQVMARIQGVSVTRYLNDLISLDRENRAELYARAKELMG